MVRMVLTRIWPATTSIIWATPECSIRSVWKGSQPAIPNFQIADLLGGALTAAMGILAAVIEARQSGQGRYIDVSMTDSVLAHTYFTMLRLNDAGRSAPRGTDLLSGGLPCYATYRCADGKYMAVGALEGKFWQLCCTVLGRPEWITRQWDASLKSRDGRAFCHARAR